MELHQLYIRFCYGHCVTLTGVTVQVRMYAMQGAHMGRVGTEIVTWIDSSSGLLI